MTEKGNSVNLAELKLAYIQNFVHRRLGDLVNRYGVKQVYVTYNETGAVIWIEEDDNTNEVLEVTCRAISDIDNITTCVFNGTYKELPELAFLCYREGVWYG